MSPLLSMTHGDCGHVAFAKLPLAAFLPSWHLPTLPLLGWLLHVAWHFPTFYLPLRIAYYHSAAGYPAVPATFTMAW